MAGAGAAPKRTPRGAQALAAPASPAQLSVLGELMRQSHESYSACGLASAGTDALVALVEEERARAARAGLDPQLHGAKITGGGCGGARAGLRHC